MDQRILGEGLVELLRWAAGFVRANSRWCDMNGFEPCLLLGGILGLVGTGWEGGMRVGLSWCELD